MAIWEQDIPLRVRAMALAGRTLFVAGVPDVTDPEDPLASFAGRKGGLLQAFSAADGKKLAEYALPSPPVWEGVAAAGGRLYVATAAGGLLCLGAGR